MEHQRDNRRLRKEVEDLKASVDGKEKEVAKMRNESGVGKAVESAKDQRKEDKRKADMKELKLLRKEKKEGEWEVERVSRERRGEEGEEYRQAFDEGVEFQKHGGQYIGGREGQANEDEQSLGEGGKGKGAEEDESGGEGDNGDEANDGGEVSRKKGRKSLGTPSGHQGHAGTRSNGGRKDASPK
jgi:superfamily II DNA helicase RecQ